MGLVAALLDVNWNVEVGVPYRNSLNLRVSRNPSNLGFLIFASPLLTLQANSAHKQRKKNKDAACSVKPAIKISTPTCLAPSVLATEVSAPPTACMHREKKSMVTNVTV